MKKEFRESLEDSPIIAAIKDEDGLQKCKTADTKVVFILYGDICNISRIVSEVKSSGKIALVHLDLIHGLSSKEIAVDFIHQYTNADVFITTKPQLIKRARELNMFTVLGFFVIDSMAFDNIEKQLKNVRPDVIEILPALMPKVISRLCATTSAPIIAGGLVADKDDIMELLNAGVMSVSTTNPDIWEM